MKTTYPTRTYRQLLVHSASPVGLVVALYGTALDSLRCARTAIKEKDIERLTRELNHLLAVVGELQGSLEFERGGEVARHLARFYDLTRTRILEANVTGSEEILLELTHQFLSLREAWQQVDHLNAARGTPSSRVAEGSGEDLSQLSAGKPHSSGWRA